MKLSTLNNPKRDSRQRAKYNKKRRRSRHNDPPQILASPPIKLPQSVLLLLRSKEARLILHQLSMPILYFYKDLLKNYHIQTQLRQNKLPKQMQRSILLLLREIVIAQRIKLASSTIQRLFRNYMLFKKHSSALTIQLWRHTVVACQRVKTVKALRFLRRLTNRHLLSILKKWHQEIKLLIYSRKNMGPKTKIFRNWKKHTAVIVEFKEKIRRRWLVRLNKPMLLGWWGYMKKAKSLREFIFKVIMGEKRNVLYKMHWFVVEKRRSIQLQNWVRCMKAYRILLRLKVHAFAKHIAATIVITGGRLATREIKRRGAVAMQKICRSYAGKKYARRYRVWRKKEFQNRILQWQKSTKHAGRKAVRKKLNELNESVFDPSVKKKKSKKKREKKNKKNRKKLPPLTIEEVEEEVRGRGKSLAYNELSVLIDGIDGIDKKNKKKKSFARKMFEELDIFQVGEIPLVGASTLFSRAGMHLSKTEIQMTGNLLGGENQQINVNEFERFVNSNVVYESSTTPVGLHVSLLSSIVNGLGLNAIRKIRSVNGESTKRKKEQMALAEAQIDSQLKAWKRHELNQIYCLQCRTHFCFTTELLFGHLGLDGDDLRGEFRPNKIMKTHRFSCPFMAGKSEMKKARYLSEYYGNEIIYEVVNKYGKDHAHALSRLAVGGLLG